MAGCNGVAISQATSAIRHRPQRKGKPIVEALIKQLAAIDAKLDALVSLPPEEFTDEKEAEHAKLVAERDKTAKRLSAERVRQEARRAEEIADRQAPRRITSPDVPQVPQLVAALPTLAAEPIDHDANRRFGYQSFGEFASEVRRAGFIKAPTPRLMQTYNTPAYAAVIGMNEGISSEGGALIPPQFSQAIMSRVNAADSLLSRTNQYTIPADTMTWPRNLESSRATGSRAGGVRTYWRGEGNAPSTSFPKFGKFTLNLHKLISLAGVTDELLRDANASVLEKYLFDTFTDEITFETNAAIVAGTGAGQPIGLKGAPCAVSVSKESGQVAATIVPANIVKMWSRLWAGCRANAVWLINQDTEPQLNLMSFGLGTAGVMMYLPPGGLSAAPYATLMGRPVLAVEQCETLGTAGDIILTDLQQYVTASNGGGPVMQSSMHLYFDTDQMAFRVTYRIDGAPWWASAITPYKGTATQSCIVTLATRA